jgi:hypothetical protein
MIKTVFVGVIPGVNNLAGVPFRTDLGQMYNTEKSGAEYQCRINGGRNRYFFIEERYWIEYPGTDKKSHVGNIKQIHHYNQDNEKREETAGESSSNGLFKLAILAATAVIGIAALTKSRNSRAKTKQQRSKQRTSSKADSGNTTQNASTKETTKRRGLQLPGRKDGRERGMG